MNKDTSLKREVIKYIRDKAKSAYVKQTECYICGGSTELELHHFYSISELFNLWCRAQGRVVSTEEEILACRDQFILEHDKEIYKDVRTLCRKHHKQLHSLYGQHPPLKTANKQENWCDKLREKHGRENPT